MKILILMTCLRKIGLNVDGNKYNLEVNFRIMVQIETYNPYEIDIKFDLNEGDITVKKGVEADFGRDDVHLFENELFKGDYVTFDTADKTVKKAAEGDDVIGQIITHPSWNGKTMRPTADASEGTYTPRKATVRLNCDYVHAVKLADDNAAIVVGDPIAYAGNNEFDKASSDNGTFSLYNADALSGDTITVMYGFRPM